MANQELRINIEDDNGGGYKTGIDYDKLKTKKANNITWFFDVPLGFPADSTLYLNFFTRDPSGLKVNSAGPMQGSQWEGGYGSAGVDGRRIRGNVKNTALNSYPYVIGFRDAAGADHVLMDPEIIVEGNAPVGGGGKKRKAGKKAKKAKLGAAAGRKRAAKKSAKKKSAKKAKQATKAKPATRSTKRKAKKR